MDVPETRYAKAPDGVSLAYQVVGDGPVDLLWLDGARGNLEVMWEQPLVSGFFTKLARRCRVIRFDKRGTGLSDRGERPPILEAEVQDARVACDALGSPHDHRRPRLGVRSGGHVRHDVPRRATGLILAAGQARNRWAPEYPWGFSRICSRRASR